MFNFEEFMEVESITLVPRSTYYVMPNFSYQREEDDMLGFIGSYEALKAGPKMLSIENINLDMWSMGITYGYTDQFKKIASVVGNEEAKRVIAALNKPVPENWDDNEEESG